MPTRSGKTYLIAHKCHACDEGLYSHINYNYKCRKCWGKQCKQWAKENIMNTTETNFVIRHKNHSDEYVFSLLKELLQWTGKYISAECGLQLFKSNPTNKRGHIVCSFIADWWEINSNKKWPPYLVCYYGHFNKPIESWYNFDYSIPPKMPPGPMNSMINNANKK